MSHRFIAIEGNIGAGKTTLARQLAAKHGARLVLEEFAHNPLLPAFYADPATHAFSLELSFLADRCEQLRDLSTESNEIIISDYLIDKSLVFGRNNLNEADFSLFERIFRQMTLSLPQPDLIIYLDSSIHQLQQNIQKRGRSFEQAISIDYLININQLYRSYLETLTIPVRMIEINRSTDISHYQEIEFLLSDFQ